MYEITFKEALSEGVHLLKVRAPKIAERRKAGQFVITMNDDKGERIPLTMTDSDPKEGTITLVFQEVGKSTKQLGQMKRGDKLFAVAGPLGKPTHIEKFGWCVCIGGGLGIAPVYPIVRALKDAGNEVVSIIGARSKNLLILEEEMRAVSDKLLISTDDGSYGHKGFVTDVLKRLIEERGKPGLVVAIGPVPMMKFISLTTRPHKIFTMVSLNPIMVDGTGMCGVCRVNVGGNTRFGCVDGPEFDGHLVDYDELMNRLKMYNNQEKFAVEHYAHHKDGRCWEKAL